MFNAISSIFSVQSVQFTPLCVAWPSSCCYAEKQKHLRWDINGLVQDCGNSNVLALELLQSCTETSLCGICCESKFMSVFLLIFDALFVILRYLCVIIRLRLNFIHRTASDYEREILPQFQTLSLKKYSWNVILMLVNLLWQCVLNFFLHIEPRKKMAAILQVTYTVSWMKSFVLQFKFNCCLFLGALSLVLSSKICYSRQLSLYSLLCFSLLTFFCLLIVVMWLFLSVGN